MKKIKKIVNLIILNIILFQNKLYAIENISPASVISSPKQNIYKIMTVLIKLVLPVILIIIMIIYFIKFFKKSKRSLYEKILIIIFISMIIGFVYYVLCMFLFTVLFYEPSYIV